MSNHFINEKSCGIIIKDNKLLFYKEQRNDQNKNYGYIYKLPGGKVDEGETPEIALVREFQEECGLVLNSSQYNLIGTIDGPLFKKGTKVNNGISRLQLFHCKLGSSDIKPIEASIVETIYLTSIEVQEGVSNGSIQEIASLVVDKLIEDRFLF